MQVKYKLLPWTLLYIFCLICFIKASGQDSSTVAIRLNELIQLNRNFNNQQKFDSAVFVIQELDSLTKSVYTYKDEIFAQCMQNIGSTLFNLRALNEALPYALQAKEIRQKILKENHPDIGHSFALLGLIYRDLKEFENSEFWFLEAKKLYGDTFGILHPAYAGTLNNLGVLYKMNNFNEKAEAIYLESIKIKKSSPNYRDQNYAGTLINLAQLYVDVNAPLDLVDSLLHEAKGVLELMEEWKLHSFYYKCNYQLAYLYQLKNDLNESLRCYFIAKDVREKVFGSNSLQTFNVIKAIADNYVNLGRYEDAQRYYFQAKGILTTNGDSISEEYTDLYFNLAYLYQLIGDYRQSEFYFLAIKKLYEDQKRDKEASYAGLLKNLSNLYLSLGNYEKSETLLKHTLTLAESLYGKDHPEYGTTLGNLANLYVHQEKYSDAEKLYIESSRILEFAEPKDNILFATSLDNLANVNTLLGRSAIAEKFFQQSLGLRSKYLGMDHPEYIRSLVNYGELYFTAKQFHKADSIWQLARSGAENVLGLDHPDYIRLLGKLAELYIAQRNYGLAEKYLLESNSREKKLLVNATTYLSEGELQAYMQTYIKSLDIFYTYLYQNKEASKIIIEESFNNILFYKNYLLNAASSLAKMTAMDSSGNLKIDELKSLKRLLSIEYSKPKNAQKNRQDLIEKIVALEKDLISKMKSSGEMFPAMDWTRIQGSLAQHEAAIEMVRFHRAESNYSDSVYYAAIVLTSESTSPEFISLFNEQDLIASLKRDSKYHSDIAHIYTRGASPILAENSDNLYNIIWKPLEDRLVKCNTIYYSPTGLLHRINIEAIPVSEFGILADKYNFIRLGSTLTILSSKEENINLNSNLVLFGGIEYDIDTAHMEVEANVMSGPSGYNDLTYAIAENSSRAFTSKWLFLEGTLEEIRSIKKLAEEFNIHEKSFSGKDATEGNFKSLFKSKPSPYVLHIASHGYFFPDPVSTYRQLPSTSQDEIIFKMSDHPMVRSGLILAGANYAWTNGRPLNGEMEDGILTAYEISQLDLSQTELVVLSACETGLGDIQGNEGVYGLQRAFKIAGAKYLIMSLWQVPDKQTSLLMTTFYKKWLEDKMSIPEAFHAAQKLLRESGLEAYYWAGFVLVE